MMISNMPVYACACVGTKRHHLTFDGGSSGSYVLALCDKCYDDEDKLFLISEEKMNFKEAVNSGGKDT